MKTEKFGSLKYPQALARTELYEGQKVWKTDDWFGAPLYPGPRIIAVMRQTDSAFPTTLNSKREVISIFGPVREALADYNRECREAGDRKDFVLDGRLAVQHGDGFIDFPDKIPPKSSGALLKFYVDDWYSWSVFDAGEGSMDWTQRRSKLKKIVFGIGSKHVRITHYEKIESKRQLREMKEESSALRGFDLILRRDVPYRSGRSGNILRVEVD